MRIPALAVLLLAVAGPALAQQDDRLDGRAGDLAQRMRTLREMPQAPAAGAPAASSAEPAREPSDLDVMRVLSSWAAGADACSEKIRAFRASPSKKGLGLHSDVHAAASIMRATRAGWYYTWWLTPHDDAPGEFVPMVYGVAGDAGGMEKELKAIDDLRRLNPRHVLGYNEPDLIPKDRKNLPIGTKPRIAADDPTWDAKFADRLPPSATRVSHASSHPNDWFREYMAGQGEKFPEVAIHVYVDVQQPFALTAAVDGFHRQLAEIKRAAHGRPIWITEMGLATWHADDPAKVRFTPQQEACFMATVLPELDRDGEVARYAWFSQSADGKRPQYPTLPGALWYESGRLTPLGLLYSR